MRWILSGVACMAALLGYWYVLFLCIALLACIYGAYEGMGYAVVFDALFGDTLTSFPQYFSIFVALCIVLAAILLRTYVQTRE
jgi:hypothetical protein